ncbi:hypothetical protein B2G74_33175 [Burkholderia sp. A27]|nr:hypothetical protein B2G74_33175 [Burkholderia sp. A27]
MTLGITRSSDDIVAEVEMSRTNFEGSFLLVEGASDSRFFKRHVSGDCAELVICSGKLPAVGAINALNARNFAGALAVVDDDFDTATGVPATVNLLKTDTHDIETLLLSSPALEHLLREKGDPARIARFEETTGTSVVDSLVERASVFGCLRFLNDGPTCFRTEMDKAFRPWKFFDVSAWKLDTDALRLAYANAVGISETDLATLLGTIPEMPIWNLVHGHDALVILAIGLREVLGACQCTEADLGSWLRLAYSKAEFDKTALRADMVRWESSSNVFKLFA